MIKKGLKTKEQIDKEWDEFWADAAHENDQQNSGIPCEFY